jgi:hypothetical protein
MQSEFKDGDNRKQKTGKRITTYNQYRKAGGKQWQSFKEFFF